MGNDGLGLKVIGICGRVVFTIKQNADGSTCPPEFNDIDDLTTLGFIKM